MAYTLISTTTLASNASTITISGIPSTYKDLAVLFNGKFTNAANWENLWYRFTGVTTGYFEVGSYATTTSSGAFLGNRTDYWYYNNYTAAAGSASNQFSSSWFYIHNYASTTTNKTTTGIFPSQYYGSSSKRAGLTAGRNSNNGAVAGLFLAGGTGDFIADTRISVYGIW
jgi:hypothetical protein